MCLISRKQPEKPVPRISNGVHKDRSCALCPWHSKKKKKSLPTGTLQKTILVHKRQDQPRVKSLRQNWFWSPPTPPFSWHSSTQKNSPKTPNVSPVCWKLEPLSRVQPHPQGWLAILLFDDNLTWLWIPTLPLPLLCVYFWTHPPPHFSTSGYHSSQVS